MRMYSKNPQQTVHTHALTWKIVKVKSLSHIRFNGGFYQTTYALLDVISRLTTSVSQSCKVTYQFL